MAMNKAWFTAALLAAARLTRGARGRQLKIQASWPWARDIVTAWERISALARATGCPMRTLLSGAVFPCL